jgi:hypothetical protein
VVSSLRASEPKNISPLSMRATYPAHLILLDLIFLTILAEEYQLVNGEKTLQAYVSIISLTECRLKS